MTNYYIATALSFVTACFTMAASWTKDPKRTYWYQMVQCIVYSFAAYFFGVYSAIIMMVLSAWRNYLIAVDKYRAAYCFIFSALALVVGTAVNTSGIIGLITVAATVQYSLCGYYFKSDIAVKVNVGVNLALWLSYDFLVRDIFSGVMDSVSAVLAVVTIFRILSDRKKAGCE